MNLIKFDAHLIFSLMLDPKFKNLSLLNKHVGHRGAIELS